MKVKDEYQTSCSLDWKSKDNGDNRIKTCRTMKRDFLVVGEEALMYNFNFLKTTSKARTQLQSTTALLTQESYVWSRRPIDFDVSPRSSPITRDDSHIQKGGSFEKCRSLDDLPERQKLLWHWPQNLISCPLIGTS